MLDRIKKIIFSNTLTALALLTYAVSIGVATFIESSYSTNAARSVVYNTWWFEMLHIILALNLIGNIFKYKLYRKQKLIVFTFHCAFVVVIIGAGITRYFGFEGMMHIREGSTSNLIISEKTYLQFQVHNNEVQKVFDYPLMLNTYKNDEFELNMDFVGQDIRVEYVDYMPNAIDTIVTDENGSEFLELVTIGREGRVSKYLENGTSIALSHLAIGFNDTTFENSVQILSTDSGLCFTSPYPVEYLVMAEQRGGVLPKDSLHRFFPRRLYTINQVKIVFKDRYDKARTTKISTKREIKEAEDVLKVKVTCGDEERIVELAGVKGLISEKTNFQLKGLEFNMSYGSKYFQTPFLVKCEDFRLENNPGGTSPSSYESDIRILDAENNIDELHSVFMNNVLDYGGYRLFQSSFDPDEKGTVLSVNKDYWGTMITYVGYFFLFSAMIFTLFAKNTRFSFLKKGVASMKGQRAKLYSVILFLVFTGVREGHAQKNSEENFVEIDSRHADNFGRLLVLGKDERVKPIHTFAGELMRKICRNEKYNGLNAVQILVGMMYNKAYWINQPIVYVNSKNTRILKLLGTKDNRVPYVLFFNESGYILQKYLVEATRKDVKLRGTFDKEIIAITERLDLMEKIFQLKMLKIFPKENDPDKNWYTPNDHELFSGMDSLFVSSILKLYLENVHQSFGTQEWSNSDSIVKYISKYQHTFGKETSPSDSKIDWEIAYNKINIFQWLFISYFMLGPIFFLIVILEILGVIGESKAVAKIILGLVSLCFALHIFGLGVRWYVSGHAPWSNAYEAMLFISSISILAGLIFVKNSKMALAATVLIAGTLLLVAHLDWLNPDIGVLQPVLKSYWLMIHVAVITSSYAFLTLGSLLGFIVMLLIVLRKDRNALRVDLSIKELTYINEMTLVIGVFLATIGTFLGGIWANESWGRYWGWDAKETWALVIVLYFAMVLHLRLIPKANNAYLFNLMSLLGFGTVLMTFLGVNYYLAGLHSYAGGDTPPFPPFVIYMSAVIVVISVWAGIKQKRHSNKIKKELAK